MKLGAFGVRARFKGSDQCARPLHGTYVIFSWLSDLEESAHNQIFPRPDSREEIRHEPPKESKLKTN